MGRRGFGRKRKAGTGSARGLNFMRSAQEGSRAWKAKSFPVSATLAQVTLASLPRGKREIARVRVARMRRIERPECGADAIPTLRPRVMCHFSHHLRDSAGERVEGEMHHVPPTRADHGAKDHVGFEDFGIHPIDARVPPR